jgi:uncharacterized protein YgiM (DUF1202 family)
MTRKYHHVSIAMLLALGLLLPSTIARAERVRITASRLTVRAGPGIKHKRLGAVRKGQVFEVQGRKRSWVAIPFGSGKGWVFGKHVKRVKGARPTSTEPAGDSGATHAVRATRLNVRAKASVKAKIRFRLRRGAQVSIKETKGAWRRIENRGRTGWVMGKYLVRGKLPPRRRRVRKPRRQKRRAKPRPRR